MTIVPGWSFSFQCFSEAALSFRSLLMSESTFGRLGIVVNSVHSSCFEKVGQCQAFLSSVIQRKKDCSIIKASGIL